MVLVKHIQHRNAGGGATAFWPAIEDVGSVSSALKMPPNRMVETTDGRTRIHAGIDAAGREDGDRIGIIAKSQNAVAIIAFHNGAGAWDREVAAMVP